MLSKDRCKTTAGFLVIPLLSQLWEEKNYCERRNELSSWRPVALPNHHIHLHLFKLGYDVHPLLSSVMYILSGENSTAVFTISRRRWDQNTTQEANRLNRARATYVRLLHLPPWFQQSARATPLKYLWSRSCCPSLHRQNLPSTTKMGGGGRGLKSSIWSGIESHRSSTRSEEGGEGFPILPDSCTRSWMSLKTNKVSWQFFVYHFIWTTVWGFAPCSCKLGVSDKIRDYWLINAKNIFYWANSIRLRMYL